MLSGLLSELYGITGVEGLAIIDPAGFAIESQPGGPVMERIAASASSLLAETAEMAVSNSLKQTGSLTLLAEKGSILILPLSQDHHLLIRIGEEANLGKIRLRGRVFAERISTLLSARQK